MTFTLLGPVWECFESGDGEMQLWKSNITFMNIPDSTPHNLYK